MTATIRGTPSTAGTAPADRVAPGGVPRRELPVVLPVGVPDRDAPAGAARRVDATVAKMRGYEEALLADPSLDGTALATALVLACTLRLGPAAPPTPEDVAALAVADRDYLLLEIRRASLGDAVTAAYWCPACGAEATVTDDLAALPVQRLDPAAPLTAPSVTLDDAFVDRHGVRHAEVSLRMPTVVDEQLVTALLPDRDPAAVEDALLLRCITRFGTLPDAELQAYGGLILRELAIRDRRALVAAVSSAAPGVRWERHVACAACGATTGEPLDVTRFFVAGGPGPPR
jgi:hypothetical protein